MAFISSIKAQHSNGGQCYFDFQCNRTFSEQLMVTAVTRSEEAEVRSAPQGYVTFNGDAAQRSQAFKVLQIRILLLKRQGKTN